VSASSVIERAMRRARSATCRACPTWALPRSSISAVKALMDVR